MSADGVVVARVRALFRYPVKSMAGEPLDTAQVGFHGIEGDRRYSFVRADDSSDFPWLTIRQVPAMLRYLPRHADPEDPERSSLAVRTPGGRELPIRDPGLAAELAAAYRGPLTLLRSARGLFDAFPVSLISVQSLAAIGAQAGRELDPRRFRPNVLVDALEHGPAPEDAWRGRVLAFGDGDGDGARVRIDMHDERCAVINFEPDTAARNPEVLRAVARHRDACAGVYGSAERPGAIRVGDVVRLR